MPIRVLFSMRHLGFVRNYESVLRLLAERGHRVTVVYDGSGKFGESRVLQRLAAAHPQIRYESAPTSKPVRKTALAYPWIALATAVRKSLDVLQYLHPRYRGADRLRARVEDQAPPLFARFARLPLLRSRLGVRAQTAILRAVERAIPPNPQVDELIGSRRPDVVLLTPLLWFGSSQVDYVRCARARGVPSVLCVGSWDHLTSKGAIHDVPDLVAVWNEAQKREAVELHDVPAERVAVTGAQTFDHWFGWPPRSRLEFCRQVGLPAERPFVLYVCSSPFIAPAEVEAIEQWIRAVRSSSDPALREAGVLVRPHPQNAKQWLKADLSSYPDVVVWPRAGANPIDSASRADFFDSLFHSAAVVGINTSALIEAAIVGRPVYTVLRPEFAATQEGTLHFHHLANAERGLLHVARSLDEHVAQLGALFAGEDTAAAEEVRRFVEDFVRPHGLGVPATPVFVDAIETLAARKSAPADVMPSRWLLLLRMLLVPLAVVGDALLDVQTRRADGKEASLLPLLWSRLRAGALRSAARIGSRERGEKPAVGERAPLAVAERSDRVAASASEAERRAAKEAARIAAKKLRKAEERSARASTPTAAATPIDAPAAEPTLPSPREVARPSAGKGPRADRQAIEAVGAILDGIVRAGRPILVGPWLSEVGFELLYWIPFLQWAKAHADLRPEQLVVISRGGVRSWYQHVTDNYAEIFDLVSPEEFRARNIERMEVHRGVQKQVEVLPFEQELIDKVRAQLGLGEVSVLHPSVMYEAFKPFWRRETSSALVEALTTFRVLPHSSSIDLADALPDDYVAVKFYGNASLPDTPENQAFIGSLLADLSARYEVVLLDTGLRVDDHHDFAPAERSRLHTIDGLHKPANNLAVQTEVICRARAFLGTYGGFSYLAPLQQKDSLAFYSHPKKFLTHHLEFAKRVFEERQFGSFVALDVRDTALVRLALGTSADPGLLPGREKAA